MASDDKKIKEQVNVEKSADILQAISKHYFDTASNHNAKAATTSNILLVIVGVIIAIVGQDGEIRGLIDSGGATLICVIGIFGIIWTRKQQERYYYWRHIAMKYQENLTEIVPSLEMESKYTKSAREFTKVKFKLMSPGQIRERYLWAILYAIVFAIGLGLLLITLAPTPLN